MSAGQHMRPISNPRLRPVFVITLLWLQSRTGNAAANSVTTFAGNAQHTAVYQPAAQNLSTVHWTAPIDLDNSGAQAHYGAPLITSGNTVLVPEKTASDGFQVNAYDGATGTAKYTVTTDYVLPNYSDWIPVYDPALVTNSLGTRMYYAGAGGSVFYIDNADSASHGSPVREVFYTSLANYQANNTNFNSTVFINTPITSDTNGNIFFGFRVQGTAPAPLNTSQSGFARIDLNGNSTYVLAGTAAGDSSISYDSHNSAPALSNDQSTLYVPVKSAVTEYYGYLLGLDATTLATKYKVFLKDPRNSANDAGILDDATSSPTIAPDGDVYFGIYANPDDGSRGFLLRFSSDLTVEKNPGAFGWDYTPGIVPASMVPSYTGTSSYLIFLKYANYADEGTGSDGDGVNRIALLDPASTQIDPHPSADGLVEMREVLTMIGPTPNEEEYSSIYPYAVHEWCVNTPAINPATNSIFVTSEDGNIYRWNLVSNSLTQAFSLTAGVGEPYVPTIIGPDGTIYTLNGGSLSALGNFQAVGITLTSSIPDTRTVVAGQSVTFIATVANPGPSGGTPTGTVTFLDTTYQGLNQVNSTLAAAVALNSNGQAAISTSALTVGNGFLGNHFITAVYSGNFPPASMMLVQKVHANASTTTLTSSPNPANPGQAVAFTATVAGVPQGSGTPTGMVTFTDGAAVLAQIPLDTNGNAGFSTSTLAAGTHSIVATYASDTIFAASSGTQNQVIQGVTASISGQITLSGSGLAGVTVSLSNGFSTATNSSGNYSFTGLTAGSTYTVTPSLSGYQFTPPSQTFANISGSQVANFVASSESTYSISGQITLSGQGLAAVTVSLSNGATTSTNIAGNYSFTGLISGTYSVTPSLSGYQFSPAAQTFTALNTNQTANFAAFSVSGPLGFVAVTPCRVLDTRNANGTFGGPSMSAGSTRSFPIPSSSCGIPSNAAAYSVNVTVVPSGPLSYLTLWPTGQPQPYVSTLNAFDGRIVANAAIVPTGTGGAISIYVTNQTDVIVDIDGYFIPQSSGTLTFVPGTPCRVADTRNANGTFGGPIIAAGGSRSFPIPTSSCGIPASAAAYSLNVTVVPTAQLGYLTLWPTGQPQPYVSTLNSLNGQVVANAAIVPAGTSGAVSVYATDQTNVILDINGYFTLTPPTASVFTAITPCRLADTRLATGPFGGPTMPAGSSRSFPIPSGACSIPSNALAYSLNVTVVPNTTLNYLTLWPTGQAQPFVSTLNSLNGQVVANAAIVPTGTSGAVSVYVTDQTDVILDINGYFLP